MPTPNSTPLPPIVTETPPPAAQESLAAMTSATIPARDVRALAAAFRGVEAPPVAQRVATD